MSFVNLMKDDVWSEVDITNRTENIIRSFLSRDEENILNRKVTGTILGQYTLTESEQALLTNFAAKTIEARLAGDEARLDNQKLKATLEYEAKSRQHDALALIPLSEDPDEAEAQTSQLEALQAELDATPMEIIDLVILRGRLVTEEAPSELPPEEVPTE